MATEAGIDAISIDGKEGGTGMSPTVALQQLGLPTLSCLNAVRAAREDGITTSIIIAGRITDGSQIVKALCLGADAVALGRPFLIAANAYPFAQIFIGKEFYKFKILKKVARTIYKPSSHSIDLIISYVKTLELEIQLLVSSLGKYSLDLLSKEDVQSIRLELSHALGVGYIYSIPGDYIGLEPIIPSQKSYQT